MNRSTLIAFGKRLRTLRLRQKLSQEQLALAADLDRSYVGGVERGERNVSLINLKKLAQALHTDVSTLLRGV